MTIYTVLLDRKKDDDKFSEAQLGGGRPGARPPQAPERAPPLQNEKKERMAKISITGIRKPIVIHR